MYKSPIDIFYGEIETKLEGDIYKVSRSYGIDIDKEELIHALQYDRNQYQKGYDDGFADGVDEANQIHQSEGCWIPLYDTSDGWRYECSNCGNSEIAKIWVWKFCPHCGHPMKNEIEEINQ